MKDGKCTFCKDAIDTEQDYQRVIGWERRRSHGGTNAVRGREPQPQWACRWCIEKVANGIPVQQAELFA